MINKIYKFLNNENKYFIKEIILSNTMTILDKFEQIINIIRPIVKELRIEKDDERQDYIVSKILKYIGNKNGRVFIDIGGGNGNILNKISISLSKDDPNIIKDNYICVETKTDWIESYDFSNKNIIYKFWDNKKINIPDKIADIILCMVSLHHIKDDILINVFDEIHRIIKPGGLIMIKEHDCIDNYDIIEWEHNLYHILDMALLDKELDTVAYFNKSISNFKSADTWKNIIIKKGFKWLDRTNRFLDGPFIDDIKNVSRLYWDIFYKMEENEII